jgi:hypothetical protein
MHFRLQRIILDRNSRRTVIQGMTPTLFEVNMHATKEATIRTVLNGLLNRYETLCRRVTCGSDMDDIGRTQGRIMDVIASLYDYDDTRIPDVLHVTHGYRIYRVDFVEGLFVLIGTSTVDLTTTITPAVELN